MEEMLEDVTTHVKKKEKPVCFLPFYQNEQNTGSENTWIIGSILAKKYYTVWDLRTTETPEPPTPEENTEKLPSMRQLEEDEDSITITMGIKNPAYIPTLDPINPDPDTPDDPVVPDDNLPDDPKPLSPVVIILAILLAIGALGILGFCIKKRKNADKTFSFDGNG